MEVHPAYKFTDEEWNILPHSELNRIIEERASYKKLRTGHAGTGTVISEITTQTNQNDINNNLQTIAASVNHLSHQISQVSNNPSDKNQNYQRTGGSIIGGRNEQSQLRSRSPI